MATITRDKVRLATFNQSQDATRQTVDSSGTAFVFEDLVTRSSTSGVDKLTADVTVGTDYLALAAEPSSDSYYEPIVGNSFGDQSDEKQVFLLSGREVEITASGTIAESHFGNLYDIGYNSTDGVPVALLATTSTSGIRLHRLADPVFKGDIGDVNVRVVGTITDDLCL